MQQASCSPKSLCLQWHHTTRSEPAARRQQLEVQAQEIAGELLQGQRAAPEVRSFNEAVTRSGLLPAKPPTAPGESGSNTFITQPFQQLSWYPR